MGHIRLSREADLVVVAPATADLLAKMAMGLADDLASTALLATDKPVLVAPAMNVRMWEHAATQRNLATLEARGVRRVGPNAGALAGGELGPGRMAEPLEIVAAIEALFVADARLGGRRALVTSGPTHEPIDPVRFIANRSSGKQGHAIAAALARLGAETVLVSGPTARARSAGRARSSMSRPRARCWPPARRRCRPTSRSAPPRSPTGASMRRPQKIKKRRARPPSAQAGGESRTFWRRSRNAGNRAAAAVVGFAAETENLIENAQGEAREEGLRLDRRQ